MTDTHDVEHLFDYDPTQVLSELNQASLFEMLHDFPLLPSMPMTLPPATVHRSVASVSSQHHDISGAAGGQNGAHHLPQVSLSALEVAEVSSSLLETTIHNLETSAVKVVCVTKCYL